MNDSELHSKMCAWGVWYEFEIRGPKPHADAQPWAKQVKSEKIWDGTDDRTYSDEEMEEVHAAYVELSRHNWPAACILSAHYRDWRLSERKAPQPFVNEVLREARKLLSMIWNQSQRGT